MYNQKQKEIQVEMRIVMDLKVKLFYILFVCFDFRSEENKQENVEEVQGTQEEGNKMRNMETNTFHTFYPRIGCVRP